MGPNRKIRSLAACALVLGTVLAGTFHIASADEPEWTERTAPYGCSPPAPSCTAAAGAAASGILLHGKRTFAGEVCAGCWRVSVGFDYVPSIIEIDVARAAGNPLVCADFEYFFSDPRHYYACSREPTLQLFPDGSRGGILSIYIPVDPSEPVCHPFDPDGCVPEDEVAVVLKVRYRSAS